MQDMDAWILMEFRRATKIVRTQRVTAATQARMATLSKPYVDKLLAKGYSMSTVEAMMRKAVGIVK